MQAKERVWEAELYRLAGEIALREPTPDAAKAEARDGERSLEIRCSPADRTDPRASPLRGKLVGLPPAFVVTCEFDPLRDEGIAYAEALGAAGVPVEQLKARGHFHASFTMVDVVITGASGRARMAEALRRFAGLPQDTEQSDKSARHDRKASAAKVQAAAE